MKRPHCRLPHGYRGLGHPGYEALKTHRRDFRKGADWSDQRCRPASPLNLVQRPLSGFGGKDKSSRAKPGPKRDT
jgi:hypothetical protein